MIIDITHILEQFEEFGHQIIFCSLNMFQLLQFPFFFMEYESLDWDQGLMFISPLQLRNRSIRNYKVEHNMEHSFNPARQPEQDNIKNFK